MLLQCSKYGKINSSNKNKLRMPLYSRITAYNIKISDSQRTAVDFVAIFRNNNNNKCI